MPAAGESIREVSQQPQSAHAGHQRDDGIPSLPCDNDRNHCRDDLWILKADLNRTSRFNC